MKLFPPDDGSICPSVSGDYDVHIIKTLGGDFRNNACVKFPSYFSKISHHLKSLIYTVFLQMTEFAGKYNNDADDNKA